MEKDKKTPSKIIETYAEDMAKVIENDKSGLIKKIIHEEEKHEIEKMNLSPESKKNKLFLLLGLLFIALGLAVLFFFIFTKDASFVSIEKQFTPLIFNDQSAFIEVKDLKKEEIAQIVFNKVNTAKVKNGGVEGIYLTENKQMIGLRRFISLVKGSFVVPNDALFVDDNFLMGIVNNETKDFFILLKVRSIADVFNSLRAWENKMFFDLHEFWGFEITSETKYLLTANFEDGIVENKNARILYDKDHEVMMMYILADNNSIVITNTKSAGEEIMLRLTASNIKK